MKKNLPLTSPYGFIMIIGLLFSVTFSCKKDTKTVNPASRYSNLPAEVSAVAQWYDKQVSKSDGNKFVQQNVLNWEKVIRSIMPDHSLVYTVPIFQNDSLTRELNVRKTTEKQLFAVIKESRKNKQTGIVALKFLNLRGEFIEEGILTTHHNYLRKKN